MGTRPNGRTQVPIVFMVMRHSPRHRFNQDRLRRWTWMRYGICAAMAAIPMPPLPCGVVPPPALAPPVSPLRSPTDHPRLFVGTKKHVPLTVPMGDVLHDLLKARYDDDKRHRVYVFPAGRSDSDILYVTTARGPLLAIEQATGVHVSLHDLRRTVVSVAIECRVDYTLRQRLLNHSSKSVHDDYERDSDPETMRVTMHAIEKFIVDAATVAEAQASGANVISITDRKKA